MQLIRKQVYRKLYIGITGFLWVAGLLAAGSESVYMPWVNGIGLCVFFIASVMLGKYLHLNSSYIESRISSSRSRSYQRKSESGVRSNCRVRIRYA